MTGTTRAQVAPQPSGARTPSSPPPPEPGPGRRLDLVDTAAPWVLGAASLALSFISFARYPTEWDSVQLTLGLDRFDISEGSPQPPGYYLYLVLGRLTRTLTPLDAGDSLQLLAALAAAAAVATTYLVGRGLRNRWLGWAAAIFLLTSPFLRFYSSTVATYTFDALVALVLLLLAVRARAGSWHPVGAAAILGLGTGLRQTSLVLLAPLLVATAVRGVRTVSRAVQVAAAGLAGVLVWLVPMLLEQPGGLDRYRSFSNAYVLPAFRGTSIFYGAPRTAVAHNVAEATAYTLAGVAVLLPALVTAALLLLLRREDRERSPANRFHTLLLWQAFAWPFLFVLLVHFGKAGYVLSYLPAIALLMLLPASRLRGPSRAVLSVVVVVGGLASLHQFQSAPGLMPPSAARAWPSAWFTQERHGAPYRLTRTEIRKVDEETERYLALARVFDPSRDVLVYVLGDGGHRFRHATYTLPRFRIHFAAPNEDHFFARHRRLFSQRDRRIELPANGRAVFVLDVAFPEVQALTDQGKLREQSLPSGPRVWVAEPGVTVFGLSTVVADVRPLPQNLP